MSDNERRIIDYDAFNDLPPNSWLIVDSEGQGTGKIAPIKIGATYEIQDGAHSFTLVGSNGYTHTVDIPYDSVQMSYEDYQALSEVQKMDGTNRFVPDVPTDDLEPEIWQRVGRTPLTTVEKTISPAINELKGRIDDSDGEIEDIKSNLTDLDTPVDITNDLTPNTGIMSYTTPIANRMGDLVVVTFQITPNRQISQYGDLVGNFPLPKNGAEFVGIDNNSGAFVGFYLKANGVLSNRTNYLTSGHTYIIFGSYIAVH